MNLPTKFPTLIGLLLLAVLISSIIYVTNALLSPSKASESQQPDNVEVTNISDVTYTISWTTQLPSSGAVLVNTSGRPNRIYYDERDTNGKLATYTTHSVTVRDAVSSSDYNLTLLSNGKEYLTNGNAYTVHTASSSPPNENGLAPAYGSVHAPDDSPADGALVYLTVEGGQKLSTLTKSSGTWLIALNQVRTADLTSYLPTIDRMGETITVRQNELETSAITDSLNDSPVPEMILGKQYDFRKQQAKTKETNALALRPVTPQAPNTDSKAQLPSLGTVLGTTASRLYSVSLINPAQGAALPTTLPFIQGIGIPGKFVGISLGITSIISGSAKVNADGSWNYTPSQPLAIGKQSVTISTVDAQNKPVAFTHTFTILKSGTQVLGDATPSATLTDTLTPIPSLSSTPEIVPTSTLAGETPPTTGYELPTIIMLIVGIGLFAGGTIATVK